MKNIIRQERLGAGVGSIVGYVSLLFYIMHGVEARTHSTLGLSRSWRGVMGHGLGKLEA